MGRRRCESGGLRNDQAEHDQEDRQHQQPEYLPINPAGEHEPRRSGRRAVRRPTADGASPVRVPGIEAPAVELAIGAEMLLQPPQTQLCDHGTRTSSLISSTGALCAQTHAAAEPITSASSVKNSSASGWRLLSSALIARAGPFVAPAVSPPLPNPASKLNPPKPPNPPKPKPPPPALALASA